jgi:hypothetical protein
VTCPKRAKRRCRGDVRIAVTAHVARTRFTLARGHRSRVRVKLRGTTWTSAIKRGIPVSVQIRVRGRPTVTTTMLLARP